MSGRVAHEVAIVADDLTGASDTAVQFCTAGWDAELQLHPEGGDDHGAEVVAVTTDSRAMAESQAAEAVIGLVRLLRQRGVSRLYKKVDSTLRGPVRSEIDAVLGELPAGTVAVVCPAFPAVGRTVVDGTLLVHDRPVADTAVGRDPVTPVRESHVPTLLHAPLVRLAGDAQEAARTIAAAGPVVVVDAPDAAALDRVADAIVALGERALPVGSAGLAAALARRWQRPAPGFALVVVTSLHDASQGQADALAASGALAHRPGTGQLLDEAAWQEFLGCLLTSARRSEEDPDHPAVLLTAPADVDRRVSPTLVADRLADATARVVDAHRVGGLVLAGGDGARAVLTGLGGTGIRFSGQVSDGVPLGVLAGGASAGLPVATKAGGFGDPDVLVHAAAAVREPRSHS